MAQIVMAFL